MIKERQTSEAPQPEIKSFVEKCVKNHGRFLVSILQEIQATYHYLPEDSIRMVAEKLNMPIRDIYGVASSYQTFSFSPKGKHIIIVCHGTACHVPGGTGIADAISRELHIKPGETTADSMFTLETVGNKFKEIPTAALGLYTYMQRLNQGLRQIMAGCRKFGLDYISRDDIAALTHPASEISGIPYIMECDKEEAEKIIEG